jgi:hypothetical protein
MSSSSVSIDKIAQNPSGRDEAGGDVTLLPPRDRFDHFSSLGKQPMDPHDPVKIPR